MKSRQAPHKRGPYAKTAQTRQRAVEAAIEIFSTSGFRGATLTDVAERVGMTLTGLQHHFPDKTALLAAVLQERDLRSRAEVPIEPGEDATEKLLSIVDRNEQNPRLTELHTVLAAEATDPEHPAHAYFVQRYERERSAGTSYFEGLVEKGSLPAGTNAASLAALLIAVADGLQLQWLLDEKAVDMKSELRRFLHVAVPALAGGSDGVSAFSGRSAQGS
jgi:AcrR family transcriptional regulator